MKEGERNLANNCEEIMVIRVYYSGEKTADGLILAELDAAS